MLKAKIIKSLQLLHVGSLIVGRKGYGNLNTNQMKFRIFYRRNQMP